jgi:hypothetical protein
MDKVQSADGTMIAFDRSGAGPALVVVVGAFSDRSSTKSLASRLRSTFTVYEYDRRGRGDSGEAGPYAIEREVDDLAAVIEASGGCALRRHLRQPVVDRTRTGCRSPGDPPGPQLPWPDRLWQHRLCARRGTQAHALSDAPLPAHPVPRPLAGPPGGDPAAAAPAVPSVPRAAGMESMRGRDQRGPA